MKKVPIVTLCLLLFLIPALFAATENDVQNQLLQPTTHSPRSLLVNRQPINFSFNRSNLLFDQESPAYNTFVACQYDSVMGFYPRVADNFTVPYDANIDSVVFWGGYWNGTPSPPLDFYVEFYPDSGGGNGPKQVAVYSQRVGYTEYDLSGWYRYEAVIPPFAATVGETLWAVFQPILIFPPQWGNNANTPPAWGDGQEAYFKSAYFGFPQWVTATTVFGLPYEIGFQIYGTSAAPSSYTWDFETGWQGWTHTNGLTFPAAWGVEPSGTHASYTPPDAGDSTMWIDSDAAGSGNHVADTALSPVVVPSTNMTWLKWGVGWNQISSEEIYEVGLKYFDGAVWTVVPLVNYTADVSPMWDSVDVSAYASYDSVQVYFFYDDFNHWAWYAAFDNVKLFAPLAHDVGTVAITSPPEGACPAATYDVIGHIHNFGTSTETFDAHAEVWDTTAGWTSIFSNTVTLTGFPAGADSNVNFGSVTFDTGKVFYTEIYTLLAGDEYTGNDTVSIYSRTQLGLGDIVFEMDAETPCGDNQLLGVEFDGTYFYVTGGNTGSDPNKVYVLDTLGTLIWTMDQPSWSTGWGWRDLAWDNVYAGADRVDTLYGSVTGNVDAFGIDLTTGTMSNYSSYAGPETPNRALAWMDDSLWFWTANFSSPVYKFSKSNSNLGSVGNSYSMYGAAYDTDTLNGGWVWWHSQDDPGTGWPGEIEQFDPLTMTFTGVNFGYLPTITVPAVAGGLCFYDNFRGMEVLFALVQGTPDAIIGLYVRPTPTGVAEKPGKTMPLVFGLSQNAPNPVKNGHTAISYTTTTKGSVSLKIYNSAGRLVRTLVDRNENPGQRTVTWNGLDNNHQPVAAGVYFYRLTAENKTATNKMVVVK